MIIEKDGFVFEEYTNSVKVVALKMKLLGDLAIPDKINGKPVTIIAADVFSGLPALKKVCIPDCLLTIGERAFESCQNLTDVIVYRTHPNHAAKILEINQSAFAKCSQLKYFSSSVPLFLYDDVFGNCKRLKNLNAVVVRCGRNTFYNCDSLEQIAFDKNISWEMNSFYNCKELKTLLFNGNPSKNVLRDNAVLNAVKDKTWICKSDFSSLDLAYDGFKIKIV